jgi:RNAse (barnase) inhibitor barstar
MSKKIQNSEQKSFYLCTRNEIAELQRISNYGNFFKIENADFETVKKVEDLRIIKISYDINSGQNLILRATNLKGINVLSILISKVKNCPETIEFVNVVEMNTFKYEDYFDEVIYIVENDKDVMEKMKIALKLIKI